MSAVLNVRRCALGRLRGLVSVDRVENLSGPAGGAQGEDWVQEGAPCGGVSHATEVLPRLAAHVRVVEPEELKEALRGLAEQVWAAAV